MAQAYPPSAYGDALDERAGAAWPSAEGGDACASQHGGVERVADDAALCSLATRFITRGLASRAIIIVLVTPEHERRVSAQLALRGVEVVEARASGQLRFVDAASALEECTGEAGPDSQRVRSQLELWTEGEGSSIEPRPVFVYSDLADLSWRAGQLSEAVVLEDIWSEIAEDLPYPLSWAHAIGGLFKVSFAGSASQVLETSEESGVQPALEPHARVERALRQALREARSRESSLRRELERLSGATGARSSGAPEDGIEGLRRAAAHRTERLVKITAAIAGAVDRPQVLWAVVDNVAAALAVSSIGLWLLSENGERLQLARSIGYRPEARVRIEDVPLSGQQRLPASDAVLGGEPIWIQSQAELLSSYPHLRGVATPGRSYSVACLPLVFQGQPRGCVGFTFDDERIRVKEERDLLLLVARYSGQAIERLRLLETERGARAQTELAAARLAISSRASRAFAAASQRIADLPLIIADQVTAECADACGVALVAAGGALTLSAVRHRASGLTAAVQALMSASPAEPGGSYAERVVSSGRALRMSGAELAPDVAALPAELRAGLDDRPLGGALFVPLSAGDETFGVLSAFRHEPEPFTEDDARLIAELADRAALGLVAARLHEANHQARARAELLYELAAAVIRAKTVEDVFLAALAGIERALGASRCSILVFDPDGVMRFKAWRGLSAEYRRAVEGHSPWDRHADNPQPIVVADVNRHPGLSDYVELFRTHGIGALGFIPLVWEGRLIGKFMVYYPAPRALTASELDMAQAIANHIASAIGRFSALSELQQTVRFNEIFTGMLGHDLRNPLGAIMAAAHIALRRSDTAQLTTPLSRIVSSGARMARMIDQLLDFTRVRVGEGIPIQRAPADVVPVLQQVMSELGDANPSCLFRLEAELGDTWAPVDADRMAQVFSNLIANAVQHGVCERGVSVRVNGTHADYLSVEVHNHGTIPPTLLPRLFEPMAGGDRRRQNSQGLGLGLYISREIVKAHGGRIEVDSSEKEGTRFTVRVPRASGVSETAS